MSSFARYPSAGSFQLKRPAPHGGKSMDRRIHCQVARAMLIPCQIPVMTFFQWFLRLFDRLQSLYSRVETKTSGQITIQIMLNCLKELRLLTLVGAVVVLVFGSGATCPAQNTNASPPSTPAPAASPAPATVASPRPASSQTPSIEDRVASLEAYINNTDGTKTLPGVPGPGHNAWMMTASALVLFMTLPGLALFYGGLVRRKNVLSVLAQCFGITGLVAALWWAFGERMKNLKLRVFIPFWMFLVYFPMAHMVWGITGLMNGIWNPDSPIK